MNKNRLEAFSDGVLAIIITIMVLEIKIPHSSNWEELYSLLFVFISYFLSFLFIGIYWGNHHHLLHSVKHVSPGIIWSNFNLLFWLSLIPFATGWMGENKFEANTVALYGLLLLQCGVAYTILQKQIEKHARSADGLQQAFAHQSKKGIASVILYSASIPIAYYNSAISGVLFLVVSIMWIVPDRMLEKALTEEKEK